MTLEIREKLEKISRKLVFLKESVGAIHELSLHEFPLLNTMKRIKG
jgi:hypothetical protein